MKKIALLFLLVLSGFSNAQETNDILKIDYDFFIHFDQMQHYESVLFVASGSTFFQWGNNGSRIVEEEAENGIDFSVNLFRSDSVGSFNYSDQKTDSLYSRVVWFDKTSYIVQEEKPRIFWELKEEFEEIGGFSCQKAVGAFRGRTYEVWFTPEFPVSAGPWKFTGLPGLILKAQDQTGDVQFVFKRIEKVAYSEMPDFHKANSTVISIEEFAELQDALGTEVIRKVMAKLPRGSKIESSKSTSLEYF